MATCTTLQASAAGKAAREHNRAAATAAAHKQSQQQNHYDKVLKLQQEHQPLVFGVKVLASVALINQ